MAEALVTRVIEIDVKASASASAHMKQISDQLGGIDKVAKNTQSSMGKFFDFVKNGVKAFVGLFVVGEVTKFVLALNDLNDTAKILQERMKLVTGDSTKAGDAFLEVTRIAKDQGREIDGVARLYEKATRAMDTMGITTKGVSDLTEGFAASLRLSGSSTQEANAAMIQFGQVLASGRFQGDEFRSMMENNSVFMVELAKAAGVTMAQLREMSKEGKLNTEFLREALYKLGNDGRTMLQRLEDDAAKLPKTFRQAVSGVKSALVELLGALNTTAGETEGMFTRMAKAMERGISDAARNLRERALINAEIARGRGEKVDLPRTESDNLADSGIAYLREQEDARRMMTSIKKEIDELEKKKKEKGLGWFGMEQSRLDALNKSWKDYESTVRGVDKLFEERNRRAETQAGPATVAGWVAPPSLEKDKKGKPIEMDDLWKELEELKAEERKIEYALEGLGKRAMAVEEAILKTNMDTDSEFTKGIIASLRSVAKELDTRDFNLNLSKEVATYIEGVLKKDAERTKKEIDLHFSELNHFLAMVRKDDPILEMEHDLARIDKLIASGALSPEQLVKMEEARAIVRLNSMKKIFGETVVVVDTFKQDVEKAWAGSFDRLIDDLLDFSKSGKEIMEDFVIDFLKQVAKLQMKKLMDPLINQTGQLLSSFFTTAFSGTSTTGGGGGGGGGTMYAAYGSGFDHGYKAFAQGGIVDSPTAFSYNGGQKGVAGEAGTEAIMPLRRGANGRLGIDSVPVTVNVIDNSSAKTTKRTEERMGSGGQKEIVVMIEDIVDNAIGGGRFDSTLQTTHGISRKGRR